MKRAIAISISLFLAFEITVLTMIIVDDKPPIMPLTRPVPHICVDSTHKTCDGECECDGLGYDLQYKPW